MFSFFYGPDDFCFKVMLFTRKHERPLVLVRIGSYVLTDETTCFKYLSIFFIFRCWVAMELPCEICKAKMPLKGKFVEIGSSTILFDTVV
jgi:hypothetical protein